MYNIERIAKMEKIMNEKTEEIENLRRLLEKFSTTYDDFLSLYSYYGSPEYHEDYEAMNQGLLPEDLYCGVLTEDLLYDLIGDEHYLLEQLLELASKMVKK